MTERQIKRLHKRYNPNTCNHEIKLLTRIVSENMFGSTQECIDLLNSVLFNINPNPDYFPMEQYQMIKDSPIMMINLIDECSVSIIFHTYQAIYHGNLDYINFTHTLISSFLDNMYNFKEHDYEKSICIDALLGLFINISNLTLPDGKEEYSSNDISYNYYLMMNTLYHIINGKENQEYFSEMKNKYKSLLDSF